VDLATRFAARHLPDLKIIGMADADDPTQQIYDEGGMLPGPDARLGGPTFEEWLASTA
jgi:hypothetical protein